MTTRSAGSPRPASSPSFRYRRPTAAHSASRPARTATCGSPNALPTRSAGSRRPASSRNFRFRRPPAFPTDIAAGTDGNLWFTEALGNQIGRITTVGVVTEFPTPTADSAPYGITTGPDGNLWFTENLGNKIGRITLAQPSTLELADGRIEITVEWQSSTDTGSGHPVVLTESAGYFWFFDPANVEVLVKVVDACADYGQEWLFAGGLTDLGVTMKVKNTHNGIYKTYTNPKGTPFLPIQDTATSLILGCPPPQPSGTSPTDRSSE